MESALKDPVAYFCAEFGIDSNLPTYAGGLGILAGDTMLEAADQNVPMIGVGLLYNGRRFIQRFTDQGWQYEEASLFRANATMCLRQVEEVGLPTLVTLNFFGQEIKIKVYQQRVGLKTTLYLLSSDVEGNPENWRDIMKAEYCCGDEAQLMQQMVLGIGGVRLLNKFHIKPHMYHFQEGRPIFAHWELLKNLMEKKEIGYDEAFEEVRKNIVYTNHTLVPDGNLVYNIDLVRAYADSYKNELNASTDQLVAPGLTNENTGFSITKYALNISHKTSAVSKNHGKLSKKNWPGYNWIAITNGINMPRWQQREFVNPNVSDSEMWEAHNLRKRTLARTVRDRSNFEYDPKRLVIGWARRITPYKQVHKLFDNIENLKKIVNDPERPVQILIAGKAHPGDDWGKETIQDAMKHMTHDIPDHALYIPNYDIALARDLVSGVDVWLNTPEIGKEACGTSGMKAASNGVLNATVADGWAAEVDWDGKGWVLDPERITESIHNTLSEKIVPLYFDRDQNNMPIEWINMMRESIIMSKKFSAERMLQEYIDKLYK